MDYKLQQNETIILQTINVKRVSGRDSADELILTNLHLIYIDRGMFTKRVVSIKYYPLSTIKMVNDKPQVFRILNGKTGLPQLSIHFIDETVSFQFTYWANRKIKKWVKEITKVKNGEHIISHRHAVPGTKKVVRVLKDTFGAVKDTIKENKNTTSQFITTKCSSCKATLTGHKNHLVTCTYCGTKQKL